MTSPFRVEMAGEDDMPEIAAMIVRAFAQYPVEAILGNIDTPEAIQAATVRHRRSVREHFEETGRLCAVKAMETVSGNNKIAACAHWFIFDKPRSPEKMRQQNCLFSAEWVPEGGRREKAKAFYDPVLEYQVKWLDGRGYGILIYMATDPTWRRKGAATAVVQWGIDQCKELGIPAYLEASPEGRPVYERLGFEKVDNVVVDAGGEKSMFPAMMWWPPGTKEADKRPLDGGIA